MLMNYLIDEKIPLEDYYHEIASWDDLEDKIGCFAYAQEVKEIS